MNTVNYTKRHRTLYIIFLILCFLCILSGCCLTGSMSEFGNREIMRGSIQKANISDETLITTNIAWISYGIFGKHKTTIKRENALQFRCDYADCLSEKTDITEKIMKEEQNHYNRSIDLLWPALKHYTNKGYKIYEGSLCYSKNDNKDHPDLSKIDMEMDVSNLDEERQTRFKNNSTTTDELMRKMSTDNKFIYYNVEKYKTHYYLVIIKGTDILLVPIAFDEYRIQDKIFWGNIKYVFYPVTFILDIVTFPIQLLTETGCSSMGPCLGCPDWTGGGRVR